MRLIPFSVVSIIRVFGLARNSAPADLAAPADTSLGVFVFILTYQPVRGIATSGAARRMSRCCSAGGGRVWRARAKAKASTKWPRYSRYMYRRRSGRARWPVRGGAALAACTATLAYSRRSHAREKTPH